MGKSYLYGLSIKGIQGYIFASNELREIIGASEIIKEIEEIVKINDSGGSKLQEEFALEKVPRVLLSAAGNIRLVFDIKDDAKKVVKSFVKNIMQRAYGITAVQAIIPLEHHNDDEINKKRSLLEKALNIQRNKVTLPLDMHINILSVDPKSSRPIYAEEMNGERRNYSIYQKLQAYDTLVKEKTDYKNLSEISNDNNKIAVIHADGNGLGNFVKQFEGNIAHFSKALDAATHTAFDRAVEYFDTLLKETPRGFRKREVILGGDDLTMICDASYALEFTQKYLNYFEEETQKIEGVTSGLTACAGIAYAHEKFPFHYAITLAEELCGIAKKHTKQIDPELAPSCLVFYNTHESETSGYTVVEENMIAKTGVSFVFAPYYCHKHIMLGEEKQPTVDALIELYKKLNTKEGVLSSYDEISRELYTSKVSLDRMHKDFNIKLSKADAEYTEEVNTLLSELFKGLNTKNIVIEKDGIDKTPLIDLLELKNVEGVVL